MPADVGIPPGHKTAATGRANRELAGSMAKTDGVVFDDVVEVGGDGSGIAHVCEHVTAPLIGVENDDVRSLGHGEKNLSPADGQSS